MIKFDFLLSDELQEKYTTQVVSTTQRQMRDYTLTLPDEVRDQFHFYFDDTKIERLLNCRPEDLLGHISEVYGQFPMLADRYWPAWFLRGVPIPEDIKSLNVRCEEGRASIDLISGNVVNFLRPVATPEKVYISSLLSELMVAPTYRGRRSALAAIYNAALGNNRATEQFLAIFPAWINAFEDIFNYSALSAALGHDIVDEWKIDVCLYCNHEPIQTQGKRVKFRTDLDHFYPRTKFPFLAVTLSNLIPSGKVCNQSYKKNKDMVDYEHPFVNGVNHSRVFHLAYAIGERLTEDNFSLAILQQGSKLDKNFSGFEIAYNYGSCNELKSWVPNAFETIEMISALNEPLVEEKLLRGLVNVSKPARNERHKKFKADSINQFYGKVLVPFP
jgi:hypothetical protein